MTIDLTKYTDEQSNEIFEAIAILTESTEILAGQGLTDMVNAYSTPDGLLKLLRVLLKLLRVLEIGQKYPELFADAEKVQSLILYAYQLKNEEGEGPAH
jgi:hypothetical protein